MLVPPTSVDLAPIQGEAFLYCNPGPVAINGPGARIPLMKVVAISIVLAILGVMYILANDSDKGMRNFGWFLVVLGSAIAAVFTSLWVKQQMAREDKAEDDPA